MLTEHPTPGWYPDPAHPTTYRYWTGAAWPESLTVDERRNALDRRVAMFVDHGWRVESRTEHQAALVRGHRPNHLLHLILSLLTFGIWALLVWIPISIFGGEKRKTVAVDERGYMIEA